MAPTLTKLSPASVLPSKLHCFCVVVPLFSVFSAFRFCCFSGLYYPHASHAPGFLKLAGQSVFRLILYCRQSLGFSLQSLFCWGFCIGWRLRSSAARLGVPPLHWGTSTNQALFKKWEVHRMLRLCLEGSSDVPLITFAWL